MNDKKSFIDRIIERIDSMDGNSLQAYMLRLSKDKGFLSTILNSVDEGILVIDRNLSIRYRNTKAKELLGLGKCPRMDQNEPRRGGNILPGTQNSANVPLATGNQ